MGGHWLELTSVSNTGAMSTIPRSIADEMAKTIGDLQQSSQELCEQNEKLKTSAQALSKENEDLKKSAQVLSQEHEELRQKEITSAEDVYSACSKIEQLDYECSSLAESLGRNLEKVDGLQKALQAKQLALQARERALQEKEKELMTTKAELERSKQKEKTYTDLLQTVIRHVPSQCKCAERLLTQFARNCTESQFGRQLWGHTIGNVDQDVSSQFGG